MKETWYINKTDLKVKFIWWYDTTAILPEYDDIEDGILPKGEFSDEFAEGMIVLDLKNHKKLKKTQLPKGRIKEVFLFCKAAPLQAVLSRLEFAKNFEEIK